MDDGANHASEMQPAPPVRNLFWDAQVLGGEYSYASSDAHLGRRRLIAVPALVSPEAIVEGVGLEFARRQGDGPRRRKAP